MARSYGQIMSAIWNDPEFRALTESAQRAYLMLVTQSDISSAGTLALTLKRWSGYAIDTTPDTLSDALSQLSNARFVVVDEDTEELLARKFVRWDGGYGNEKRRPAITAAANAAVSPRIRASLADELDILSVPHSLSDRLPDALPDTPRVVVTEGESEPQPATHNTKPGALAPLAALPETGGDTAQIIIGEWIERCSKRPPSRVVGQMAKLIGEMLSEGVAPNDVRRGISVWMAKDLAPSILPSIVNQVMNGTSRNSANGSKPTVDADTAFQYGVG